MGNEKWYVISPNEKTEKLKAKGYAMGCGVKGETIALTDEKCGDILCEGTFKECNDYYNSWIEERQ